MRRFVGSRNISEIIGLFAITMTLGFLVARFAVNTSSVVFVFRGLSSPLFMWFSYVVDAVLLLMIAVLVIRRHFRHKNRTVFKILEAVVLMLTSFFLFFMVSAILLRGILPGYVIYASAVGLSLGLVLVKERWKGTKDMATMASSMGIGILLGFSFWFPYVMTGLAIFAVYDYIAVFKTNKMTKVARYFVRNNAAFLMSVSELDAIPAERLTEKERDSYMKLIKKTGESENPRFKKILAEGKIPIVSQVSLGEGDIALPLTAMISAYAFMPNYYLAAAVGIGAMAGISLTMYMLRKYMKPMPAIPLLFGFMGISSGIALMVLGDRHVYLSVLLMTAGALALFFHMRKAGATR